MQFQKSIYNSTNSYHYEMIYQLKYYCKLNHIKYFSLGENEYI